MKRIVARMGVVALCSLLIPVVSAAAQDDSAQKRQGGGNAAVNQLNKQLEVAELTSEQKAKIAGFAKELQAQTRALRQEGYTQALNKRRMEATKKAQEAGKKGADVAAAVKASFTDAENALLAKADEAKTKFRLKAFGLLSETQQEKLPQRLKRQMKAQQAEEKAKKPA